MLGSLDLAALVAGLIVGFYWARVMKLIAKTKKTTGRAGNFWPAEPLGRALRVAWVPLVVAWIALPLAIGLGLSGRFLDLVYTQPIVHWFGVAVMLLALGLTMVCWRKMGKSWRMGIDPEETTGLVVSGPFAYVRHPIYTLQILLLIATGVAVPVVALWAALAILAVLLVWEAIREEGHMTRTHGETYRRYADAVGRFLPRSSKPFAADHA
jgi:protein-S-isoprenylcysteine O-methyltransferase Ste14